MAGRGQMIPRGDRKWLLRVFLGRSAGKRQYHNKTFEGTTSQARQELTRLLRAHDTKHLTAPSTMLVRELIDAWYEFKQGLAPQTLNAYKLHLNTYLLPRLGRERVTALTPLTIQSAYNALVSEGYSPNTIRYAHTVLRQAFQWGVKMGYLGRNPCDDTERPRVTRRPPTVLTTEQMVKLFRAQAASPLLALWHLMLNAGVRPSEALALGWDAFDGTAISIRRALKRNADGSFRLEDVTKTKKSFRSVTLPASTLEVLKAHRAAQAEHILSAGPRYERLGFIFAGRFGGFLDPNNVAKRWRTALKQAGLPDVRFYDTRHSHATALLSAGVNLAWVADRLGHEDIKLTRDTYAHVLPEAHKEMADVMEQALQKAAAK